jgi:hypothetical protein
MTTLRILALAVVLGGCPATDPTPPLDAGEQVTDAGVRPDAGERPPPFDAGPPPPRGTVTGRIIDVDGEPVSELEVQCCTVDTCFVGSTDDDGQYQFSSLRVIPRKFRIISEAGGTIDGLFYQEVVADTVTALARDVILQPLPEDPVAWSEGSATLAGGTLELTVAPGALHFESGEASPVGARQIAAADLPPYDQEPWQAPGSEALAFVLTPFHLSSEEPVDLRVLSGVDAAPGTQFSVWSIDPDDATAHEVGRATVSADGILATDPGHSLSDLSVIVLLRRD